MGELGPLGGKEQDFSPWIHMAGVQHKLPDLLSEWCPARLPDLDHLIAGRTETGHQRGGQSGLATAIAAFQRNISVASGSFPCHCDRR
jgi:hypothetical protein